jgi:hypothetical protein
MIGRATGSDLPAGGRGRRMASLVKGIHHITVRASGAQEDIDFMTNVVNSRQQTAAAYTAGDVMVFVCHSDMITSGDIINTYSEPLDSNAVVIELFGYNLANTGVRRRPNHILSARVLTIGVNFDC